MTQTFASNASGDLYIAASGDLAVLSGKAAIADACATACRTQLGEMTLAQLRGLPNYQALWSGQPNLAIYRDYLTKTLLAVKGVVSVQSIEMRVNGDVISYTAQINSDNGAVVING